MENNQMQVFESEQFGQVRTVMVNGEPWFVAADVCRALEIRNNRDALARLDADEKDVGLTDTLGGPQQMTTVNEPGLYSLVLSSRKPEAKAFKRWITHDVIPSIRKHGLYMTDEVYSTMVSDPRVFAKILTDYADARDENERLKLEAQANKPKVEFAESISASNATVLVKSLANLLCQNGYKIGQNRLFRRLRDEGFLCNIQGERWNTPTQRAMDMGLFENQEVKVYVNGQPQLRFTPKLTTKGQQYFLKKYLSEVA